MDRLGRWVLRGTVALCLASLGGYLWELRAPEPSASPAAAVQWPEPVSNSSAVEDPARPPPAVAGPFRAPVPWAQGAEPEEDPSAFLSPEPDPAEGFEGSDSQELPSIDPEDFPDVQLGD